jgi:hypothetical protein
MKKTILLIALALITVVSAKAQKLKRVDTVDLSMTYKEMKKKFKSILFVDKSITLKNGSKFSIGDEVKFGNSSSKLINSYEHIYQGKMLNLASAMMGTKVIRLRQEITSTAKWFITEIRLTRTMGNIEVYFEANAKGLKGIGNIKNLNFSEFAISTGEVINPNAPLTREQAIAKLKEQKDLLDLGMVSQEDFDKLRKELTPIIMNKN